MEEKNDYTSYFNEVAETQNKNAMEPWLEKDTIKIVIPAKIEAPHISLWDKILLREQNSDRTIENAIIMALADEFGTTVTSQTLLELSNGSDRFDQISRLQVKGKLVRHIQQPVISAPLYADNMFTVKVTVDFYAKPIEYAPTEFEAKVLRNGKDDKFESNQFVADDKFYLSFCSPKAGYVAVFFEDRTAACCMLPYYGNDDTPFEVEKDKKYVFFDVRNNTYHMSCGVEPEINYVHIIFSPNQFIDGDIMREMTCRKFRDWLGKRQSYDDKMQVQSIMLKVSPQKE